MRLQKTSSRRLEDVLIKTNIFVLVIHLHLQDVFKTFSRRLQDVFKTSCKNVFKTSRHLQDVLRGCFHEVFKKFSRHPAKMSWRHLQDIFKTFWRRLQDVFKTYYQASCSVNTFSRFFPDIVKTFLTRTSKTVIYRRICLDHTDSQCTKFARVTKVSQILVFHFTTPFSGCLQRRI